MRKVLIWCNVAFASLPKISLKRECLTLQRSKSSKRRTIHQFSVQSDVPNGLKPTWSFSRRQKGRELKVFRSKKCFKHNEAKFQSIEGLYPYIGLEATLLMTTNDHWRQTSRNLMDILRAVRKESAYSVDTVKHTGTAVHIESTMRSWGVSKKSTCKFWHTVRPASCSCDLVACSAHNKSEKAGI